MKLRRYIPFLLILAVLFGGVLVLNVLNLTNQDNPNQLLAQEINLQPTSYDAAGIDLATDFVFLTSEKINPKTIADNLIIEPELSFEIKQSDVNQDYELLLQPKEPLEAEKVYKFSLNIDEKNTLKWAFQTKGDFRVLSTLPGSRATGVPVKSGIEINFSHLDYGDISEYFTIIPEVAGKFEIHNKTAVFIPKKLEPATVYTVIVKKGLPLKDSDQFLNEDYLFQFETDGSAGKDQYYLNIYKNTHEFTTLEKPFFQLAYYNYSPESQAEIKVSIFSYQDGRQYINALKERESLPTWAYQGRLNYREETKDLSEVANFTIMIEGSANNSFIVFPETVPGGFYLAEISYKQTIQQIWFQVTDLGLYSVAAENKTLYWVHDLKTGLPVAGAEILNDAGRESATNQNGLGELSNEAGVPAEGSFALIKSGGMQAVAAVYPRYGSWGGQEEYDFQNSFWRYLYLDRSLYKPNDNLHFWGVLKARENSFKTPERVTVSLYKSGVEKEILSKEIAVSNFNFTGDINLPSLLPGYYTLAISSDGQRIINNYFEIENYVKPVYQIVANPAKKVVFAGQKVDFRIQSNFFEGTPAAKIALNYYLTDQNGQITTNTEGEASFGYQPKYQKNPYSNLEYRSLYLTADLPESGEINGFSSVLVLNNDLEIKTERKKEGNSFQLDLKLNKLSLEKVNSGKIEPWDQDAFLEKPAANHPLKIKIYEEVWEEEEIGQYYDFINKEYRSRYGYNYKKVFLKEDELRTDGAGQASYTFVFEKEKSYLVEIAAQDFRGNTAIKEERVFGSDFNLDYEYSWYHLEQQNTSSQYALDQQVQVDFKKNEAFLPERAGGYLFFTCREGILEKKMQDHGNFQTKFTAAMIPNFWLKGVYFDGRHYYETHEELIHFDQKEKELQMEIKLDRDHYRPGDMVRADLEIKDKKGQAVQAIANFSLVDEALFALEDQYANVLGSLYGQMIPSGIIGSLITHEAPDPLLGMAEGGGEGGFERRDFQDAVLFQTLTTNGQGRATVEFKVPDNLTSWRLTCQAFNENLEAGTITSQVIVKLPFFVDMILADTYLSDDQIIIPLRSYGIGLKENSTIEYELNLKSNNKIINSQKLSAQAFSTEQAILPPLEKGEYSLSLAAKVSEDLADTLSLDFIIVDSLLTKEQIEFALLGDELDFLTEYNEASPLTLVFSDYERNQYLDLLSRLKMANGVRIEQRIAPILAGKLRAEYFPDLPSLKDNESTDLLNYQTTHGGIAILPYADADLELSVKLASLRMDKFDTQALKEYFLVISEHPYEIRERTIVALAGLAACDEPVLQELLATKKLMDLNIKEKLYLSLALTELGDNYTAKEILGELLRTNTEKMGAHMRLNLGKDQDDILEATAMAAFLANRLGYEKDAAKLLAYTLDNRSQNILLYLEHLLYLEEALPKLTGNAVSFNYQLQEKTEQIKLEPKKTFSILLTADQVAEIKFSEINGQVGVTAFYEAPFKAPDILNRDGVKITRRYRVNGRETNEFKLNDLVKVSLSYQFGAQAPNGPYELREFLPAGLKIIQKPYTRGINDYHLGYPIMVDGQKAVFIVDDKKDGYFNYYARVINPGQFKAEEAFLEHGKTGVVYSVTTKQKVNIK